MNADPIDGALQRLREQDPKPIEIQSPLANDDIAELQTTALDIRAAKDIALNYTLAQARDAFSLFMNSGMGLEAVALQTKIPLPVIAHWSKENNWLTKKAEVQNELFKEEELNYRNRVIAARPEVLDRHLDVAKKIEEKVGQSVESIDTEDPKALSKLKMAAEALSGAAGVSARAAAITDRPFSGDGPQGPAQIIVIGGGVRRATASASSGPKVIDIDPEPA